MFLLAKLISTNLFHQLDVDSLDYELEPGRFPHEINHAQVSLCLFGLSLF